MKITTQYENGEPFEGNRSDQYFGIALFMEREFFHTTSDTKFGKKRPDPRIVIFKRPMQEALRHRIMHAAGKHGVSFDDARKEWLGIIEMTTAEATKFVSKKTNKKGLTKDNPLSIQTHTKIVEAAFKYALRVASGYVTEREEFKSTWTIQPSLFFGDGDATWIYVRHDNPSNDLYKIGKTMRKNQRRSSYSTHTAESREIATYPESEYLTERKIHVHFAQKRVKREFFKLTQEDVEIVTNPVKMRKALKTSQ